MPIRAQIAVALKISSSATTKSSSFQLSSSVVKITLELDRISRSGYCKVELPFNELGSENHTRARLESSSVVSYFPGGRGRGYPYSCSIKTNREETWERT